MTPPSNKQTRKATESAARERAAALRAQHDREAMRRKLMARGGIGLVVVAVVAVVLVIGLANGGGTPSGVLQNVASQGAATAPPWAVPTNTTAQVNLAGLTLLPNETLDRHDHVHLDIWADGTKETVPAYIGIEGGSASTGLASLHTHDSSGIIHIESPAGRRFTLSQVFNEWNVLLTPTQIGSLKVGDGKTLTVYVNGKVLTTDPGQLELKKHQEIAIVYGTAAENAKITVPSSYKWTGGL